MPSAPIDLAYTLPESWIGDVLSARFGDAEAPLLEWLQEIVREKGEMAIALEPVQDLALFVSGRRERPPRITRALRPMLARLTSAARDGWPVETPLSERRQGIAAKHVFALAADFDSLCAEWYVLDNLLGKGARPVRCIRAGGGFDWIVERGTLSTNVEVKQKTSSGEAGHRLEWFWKGVSLLPRAKFVSQYRWRWDVPEGSRAGEIQEVMDALWRGLGEMPAALSLGLDRAGTVALDLEESFTGDALRLRPVSFGPDPSLALELRSAPAMRCFVSSNSTPGVLVCNGSSGGWIPETLGRGEAELLRRVVRGLSLERQAVRRADAGVYVVVWWVPSDWEPALESEWLDLVCEELADETGVPYIAIWPIGMFESARRPWSLSAAARRDFPWLRGDERLRLLV